MVKYSLQSFHLTAIHIMILSLLFGLAITTASLLAWSCIIKQNNDLRGLPGPSALPILGNIHQLGSKPLRTIQSWAYKYGPIYRIKIGNDLVIVINNHKLLKDLFPKQISAGRDNSNPVITAVTSKNAGITSTVGPTWDEQRRFAIKRLRRIAKTSLESSILIEADSLLKILASTNSTGSPMAEVSKIMYSLIVNTLWSSVSGERQEWNGEIGTNPPIIITRAANLIRTLNRVTSTGLLFAPSLRYIIPKLSGWTDFIKENSKFSKLMDETAAKHKENHDPENVRTFIDHYIQQIKAETNPLSSFFRGIGDKNLKTVMVELFLAGTESSSVSLCWAILYLSQNENVQQKMQIELDNVLGKTSRHPTLADKPMLPFTEAVVLETLRLCPAVPLGVPHKMLNDMEFHGYFLPKGATVWGNIYAIHHDPNVWGNDVEIFRPERFLNEEGKLLVKNDAFMPFSIGKRQCPGDMIAKNSILLLLASIFHKFSIQPDPNCLKADLEPVLGLSLTPKPFKIVCKAR